MTKGNQTTFDSLPSITPNDPRLVEYRDARQALALMLQSEQNLSYDVASNKYRLTIGDGISRVFKIEAPKGVYSDPYALVVLTAQAVYGASGMESEEMASQRLRRKDLERYLMARWIGRVYHMLEGFLGNHRFCVVQNEDIFVLCLREKAAGDINIPAFIRRLSTGKEKNIWDTLVRLGESGRVDQNHIGYEGYRPATA